MTNLIKVRRGWCEPDGISEDEARTVAVWGQLLAVRPWFIYRVLWVEAELPEPRRSENI